MTTILDLKKQAKEINKATKCGQSKALHAVAVNYGYKSWIALLANTSVNKFYNEYKNQEKNNEI